MAFPSLIHLRPAAREPRGTTWVTAYELATQGLEPWLDAVAVYWLHSQRTLCRDHVEHPVTRRLIAVLADEEDVARVLGRPEMSEYRARGRCVLCPSGGARDDAV